MEIWDAIELSHMVQVLHAYGPKVTASHLDEGCLAAGANHQQQLLLGVGLTGQAKPML